MGPDENALNAIDAVITWVDGDDPNHRKKRKAALNQIDTAEESHLSTGTGETRFIDNGELRYCLASIKTFAPWIKNIYLVTDNQKPPFLTDAMMKEFGIILVDHKEIFRGYEWALPTFNTRTIESALWRIPDLAPRYIYFNDDFILTAPVSPYHFFDNGNVVLRGKWNKVVKYNTFRMSVNKATTFIAGRLFGITRSMHLLLQMTSARLAGFDDKYFRAPHVPHPIRKITLEEFFKKHPEKFEENIRFPFRDMSQFSAIFLPNHLEIRNGTSILFDDSDAVMINGEMEIRYSLRSKLNKLRNGDYHFLCIQGFEKMSEDFRQELIAYLNSILDISKFSD